MLLGLSGREFDVGPSEIGAFYPEMRFAALITADISLLARSIEDQDALTSFSLAFHAGDEKFFGIEKSCPHAPGHFSIILAAEKAFGRDIFQRNPGDLQYCTMTSGSHLFGHAASPLDAKVDGSILAVFLSQ